MNPNEFFLIPSIGEKPDNIMLSGSVPVCSKGVNLHFSIAIFSFCAFFHPWHFVTVAFMFNLIQ